MPGAGASRSNSNSRSRSPPYERPSSHTNRRRDVVQRIESGSGSNLERINNKCDDVVGMVGSAVVDNNFTTNQSN